jgi:hypothetical protein
MPPFGCLKRIKRLKRRCRGAAGRYNVLAYVVLIAVVEDGTSRYRTTACAVDDNQL